MAARGKGILATQEEERRGVATGERVRGLVTRRRPHTIALAVALMVVTAALVPEGFAFLQRRERDRIVSPDVPALLEYLLVGFGAAVFILFLAIQVFSLRSSGRARGRRKRGWIALVALLLLVFYLLPPLSETLSRRFGRAGPDVGSEQADRRGGGEPLRSSSSLYGWFITGLFILFLVAVSGGALVMFRAEEAEPVDNDELDRELLASLDAGIDDLRSIRDPRAAVVACYARMERVTLLAGIRPHRSDTPFEKLERLLVEHEVAESSARALTVLFEQAKFSTRPIVERDRDEAFGALSDVRDQLGLTAP